MSTNTIIYSLIPVMLLGILCLWIGMRRWKKRFSCKEEIQGVFLCCDLLGFGNHIYTSAKFEYTYNGRKMKQYTLERLSQKKETAFKKEKLIHYMSILKTQKLSDVQKKFFILKIFLLYFLEVFLL